MRVGVLAIYNRATAGTFLTLFGTEFTGDHARLIAAVFGLLFAALGFLAGRLSRHREHVRFKREDLVGSTVVTELYGLSHRSPDGDFVLHIVSQGSSHPIDDFFTTADLIEHIQRAAHRHPGLVQLKNPVAHRMMMDEGKDRITGLDARANMDFLSGRPTQDDEVLFGFGAWAEGGDRRNALHDEVGRLVQMVISPKHIPLLADPSFIATLAVQHAGYKPRVARLHQFALEWRRLEGLPHAERHAATDKIWKVTVRTSLADTSTT